MELVEYKLLHLKVLLPYEDQRERCLELIKKLEVYYGEKACFLYCKGVIADQELRGAGLELFEASFRQKRNPQYAHAVLVARFNRNVFLEDGVMAYAANHSSVELPYICGVIYARQGHKQKSYTALLQALINCSENYNESLYSAFVNEQLSSHGQDIPPKEIAPDTCCVLRNNATEQQRKLWIHEEGIVLPEKGTSFAEYEHNSPNDKNAFLLLTLQEGDTVSIDDSDYTVVEINHGNVIATKYCMQKLIDSGVMKQLLFDPENPETLFKTIKEIGEPRSNHVHKVIDMYMALDPGLSLERLARAVGAPYYKAVYAVAKDNSFSFWAGEDGSVIDRDCVLTPSVIAILSFLGIRPPQKSDNRVKFYVTNALKAELEIQSREHRNDPTAAVLCFNSDGNPYMLENTPENKRIYNIYFSCLNEWANWGVGLDSVLPQNYPVEIKSIADEVGVPNIEAIVLAKEMNCLISCDDLLLRKYMFSLGINTATTIDLLICLQYSFGYIMEKATILLEQNYISPITPNFLKWVSNSFQNAENDEQLEQYSLLVVDLIEKVFSICESRTRFLRVYLQLVEAKTVIHLTLRWIIDSFLLKHFSE